MGDVNVDGLWNSFKIQFMEGLVEFIPLRPCRCASDLPKLFTRGIGKAIRGRKQAYQKWTRRKL